MTNQQIITGVRDQALIYFFWVNLNFSFLAFVRTILLLGIYPEEKSGQRTKLAYTKIFHCRGILIGKNGK